MVFKSYDIRGIYPDDIDEDFAYKIGRAFVTFLKAKKIAVARDARKCAPDIASALIEGMADQGADVYDAGLGTTPMLYWLGANHDFDGAIMVTASHNPPKYIGFKMCGPDATFINRKHGSLKIKEIMENKNWTEGKTGVVHERSYYDDYIGFIADRAKEDLTGLKLVIDTSNGCVGPVMEMLLHKLGIDARKLFFEPDGNFPNHPPNPLLPDSQVELKRELEHGDYDAGFIVDADGDRIVTFDEDGRQLKSASILLALNNYYYDKRKDRKYVFDVLNYRKSVIDVFAEHGAEPIPSPVGYANLKDELLEHDGIMGAEFSSHFQHEEVKYCDNSLLLMVKLLTVMVRTGKTLSELVTELEDYVLRQINFEVEDKDEKIEAVDSAFSDDEETLRIDGVSKTYPDYWFNVRKSNTEPLLRVTVEAETEKKVEEVFARIKEVIGITEEGERYA